ncbi:unnamed protein product [Brassica oleracea var. botrytis]
MFRLDRVNLINRFVCKPNLRNKPILIVNQLFVY